MTCNHETYVELVRDQLLYRCGKCGEVVWSYPAKRRIDWVWAGLMLALLLIWGGLLAWTFWQWLGDFS